MEAHKHKKNLTAFHYAIFAISGLIVGGLGAYLVYELYILPKSMPAIQPANAVAQVQPPAAASGVTRNATGRAGCGCGH